MIKAKKSLGQNFLISNRIVEQIAKAGEIKKDEVILEIGPGKGALTKELLKYSNNVKVVEKDDRLIPVLNEIFSKEINDGRLEIHHADILEKGEEITNSIKETYKIIANIPYYITGEIIRKFLTSQKKPENMILMVQKEVANRIIARDKKESILSISVKVFCDPELVVNVSRGNFFPIPNVDSAVIKLKNIKNPFKNKEEESVFFDIVKTGFSQKRKKLSKNLETVLSKEKIKTFFEQEKLDENIRAEDLKLNDWIKFIK